MKLLKYFILSSSLILLSVAGYSQCKTIANWAEGREGLNNLCFYPTTLRMINISKDESFNKMVKDIDKLKIVISNNKKPLKKEELTTLKNGIKSENYNDLIQFRRGNESFFVYVKEKHEKPVGFAGIISSDSSLVLIDLDGYISPEIIQQLIEGKLNVGAITKIYDITQLGENKKQNPPKK